jgi:hypothetical protein
MPAIQTTYAAQHARWIEGMVLNMEPSDVVTRLAEDVEGIGFGKVTVKFVGIAVLDATQPTGKYEQYSNVALMKKGVIVVTASVAVAVGDPVYYVPATGVLTNSASGNTLIAGAQWDTSTSGSALAALRLG